MGLWLKQIGLCILEVFPLQGGIENWRTGEFYTRESPRREVGCRLFLFRMRLISRFKIRIRRTGIISLIISCIIIVCVVNQQLVLVRIRLLCFTLNLLSIPLKTRPIYLTYINKPIRNQILATNIPCKSRFVPKHKAFCLINLRCGSHPVTNNYISLKPGRVSLIIVCI